MNSIFKSVVWMVAAVAALFFGVRFQKEREIEELRQDYSVVTTRAAELAKETTIAKTKLELISSASSNFSDLEASHIASLKNIALEQKKIDTLLSEWDQTEKSRAEAVMKVRDHATTLPRSTVTLADGKVMADFSVRSLPDEKTISVEYRDGLVKITPEQLPEEWRSRLAPGWKPLPPPGLTLDKDGHAVVKAVAQNAGMELGGNELDEELRRQTADTTSIAGVTRALAAVGASLDKTLKDFETQRATIRKLEIFKSSLKPPGSSKTYAELKKDANIVLASLAGKLQALRAEKNNLEYKLKSL